MTCTKNDCGWCYDKSGLSNDDNGQCNNADSCKVWAGNGYLIAPPSNAHLHADKVFTRKIGDVNVIFI